LASRCLAGVLILVMRVIGTGIRAGAPGWLNVVAALIAWDAMIAVTCAWAAAHRCVRADRVSSAGLVEPAHPGAEWAGSGVALPTGPKSARLGRRVVYRERDVLAWIDQQFAQ